MSDKTVQSDFRVLDYLVVRRGVMPEFPVLLRIRNTASCLQPLSNCEILFSNSVLQCASASLLE